MALRAGFAPGDARENWAIIRALSAELGATLPFDSLDPLRAAMINEFPHLGNIDRVPENTWIDAKPKKLGKGDFANVISDFYLTNPIARASQIMADRSRMEAEAQLIAAE